MVSEWGCLEINEMKVLLREDIVMMEGKVFFINFWKKKGWNISGPSAL